MLLPDQFVQRVGVGAGLAPGGDAQPEGEFACRVEFGEEVETFAVHDVTAGQTGGRHTAQRGGEAVAAPGAGGLRGGALDEVAGGGLQQQPGGPALGVADDLGGLVEGARPVAPGQFECAGADQHGVGVEHLEQRRHPVQDGGEGCGLDGSVAEDVGVQSPAVQPLPGGETAHLAGEGLAERAEIGAARQVESAGQFGAVHRVEVPVDQARGDHGSLQVDDGGARTGQGADAGVVTEGVYPPVGGGQRALREEGAGRRVEQAGGEQDEIDGHGGSSVDGSDGHERSHVGVGRAPGRTRIRSCRVIGAPARCY